uniref:hypothetical protein n=1 Tax=Acidisphaera rubrifaciens TaxID=50715 RepID=UPI000662C05F
AAEESAVLDDQLEDESMVNVANIEGQMRASSLRRVGELVERHPEESVAIMRGWLGQGAAARGDA